MQSISNRYTKTKTKRKRYEASRSLKLTHLPAGERGSQGPEELYRPQLHPGEQHVGGRRLHAAGPPGEPNKAPLSQDKLNVIWPFGEKYNNFTFESVATPGQVGPAPGKHPQGDNVIYVNVTYLAMEPIGAFFMITFISIMTIQVGRSNSSCFASLLECSSIA